MGPKGSYEDPRAVAGADGGDMKNGSIVDFGGIGGGELSGGDNSASIDEDDGPKGSSTTAEDITGAVLEIIGAGPVEGFLMGTGGGRLLVGPLPDVLTFGMEYNPIVSSIGVFPTLVAFGVFPGESKSSKEFSFCVDVVVVVAVAVALFESCNIFFPCSRLRVPRFNLSKTVATI